MTKPAEPATAAAVGTLLAQLHAIAPPVAFRAVADRARSLASDPVGGSGHGSGFESGELQRGRSVASSYSEI